MRPPDVASEKLAEFLGVVAHPQRIQIIQALRNEEKDVGTLAETLNAPQARVSQHLSLMRAHQVVSDRRDGRHVYYRLVHRGLAVWLLSGLDWLAVATDPDVLAAIEQTRSMWGG